MLTYLRTVAPYAQAAGSRFDLARQLLQGCVDAAGRGDFATAHRQAIAAYLDGIEPHEAGLRIENRRWSPGLKPALRRCGRPPIPRSHRRSPPRLRRGRESLSFAQRRSRLGRTRSATKSFLASLIIALREGLEVALLIAALLAFLRKSGQGGLSRSVHYGWLASLPAGLLTFALIGQLIDGARRELAEGLISLVAAVVLITVTHWCWGPRGQALAGLPAQARRSRRRSGQPSVADAVRHRVLRGPIAKR